MRSRFFLALVTCLILTPMAFCQLAGNMDGHGDPLPKDAMQRLGEMRFRHTGGFGAVACSPDGKILASAGSNKEVWVWDSDSGKVLHRFHQGNQHHLGEVCFTPDSKKLACADVSNTVTVWDLATGKELFEVQGACFVIAPDGKTLFTGGRLTENLKYYSNYDLERLVNRSPIRRWDMATGKEMLSLGEGVPFAISGDGKRIASVVGTLDKNAPPFRPKYDGYALCEWDAAAGKELRRVPIPKGLLKKGCYTSKGLCSWIRDHEENATLFWLWPPGEKQPQTLPMSGKYYGLVAFAPDGQTAAIYKSGEGVEFWDPARSQKTGTLQGPLQNTIGYVRTFSPDGKKMVTRGLGWSMVFWDVASGKELPIAEGHRADLKSVQFSSGGDLLYSASTDGTIRVWDVKTGKQQSRIEAPVYLGFRSAALAPDGKMLAGSLGKIGLWPIPGGKKIRELEAADPKVEFRRVAISPDSRLIAGAGDGRMLAVWEAASGKRLWEIKVPTGNEFSISDLLFSPDGRFLVTATRNRLIHFWDVASGKEKKKFIMEEMSFNLMSTAFFPGVFLAFSPDGRTLAANGPSKTIQLWELATGKTRLLIKTPERFSSLAFDASNRHLITGDNVDPFLAKSVPKFDASVRLWELATGKEFYTFQGHQGAVHSLSLSPDNEMLASGGEDTTILIWKMPRHLMKNKLAGNMAEEKLAAWWAGLAGGDAEKAYQAQWQLAAANNAVAFIDKKLQAVARADPDQVARWIKDLDSGVFKTRQLAQQQLEKIADQAEAALREALKKPQSLDAHLRITNILKLVDEPTGKLLQQLRGLEVLERIGGPEAKKVISRLAQGGEGARLTREAQATLKRLNTLPQKAGSIPE